LYHERANGATMNKCHTGLLNSSVLRRLQKQDDDEDKSRTVAARNYKKLPTHSLPHAATCW